jgi:hypothetical protein
MLARSGRIPTGNYAFELKWDGFRASSAATGTSACVTVSGGRDENHEIVS